MALDILHGGSDTGLGIRRLSTDDTPLQLASDDQAWPNHLIGGVVWDGSNVSSLRDCTVSLSEADVAEVRSALEYFHGLELYGSEVCARNFPLPSLGPRLYRMATEIHNGRGFGLVRGLPLEQFSHEDNIVVYLGISSYIGPVRGRQDEDGNMLTHIRNSKFSQASQEERPTKYSRRAATFHTDAFCDILALQTRSVAAEGGKNLVASSWTVYNKIAARCPELIKLLVAPIWPFDSRSKLFPPMTRPLLYLEDGRVILNFSRDPLLGVQGVTRPSGLPELTPIQKVALNVIEEIAQESQIAIDPKLGDVLFINNHAVLHSREAFRDSPDSSRYLMRLWLRHPRLAWKLPEELQEMNDRIYRCPELGEKWGLVDVPHVKFCLSDRLTT